MSYFGDKDLRLEIKKGNVPKHSVLQKFGYANVATSLVSITSTLNYQTPTSAVALEFISDSANDTSAGTGAREITVVGLDANWDEITQVISTNGVTAVSIPISMTRLYRWFVSDSGTYATATAGSHAGNLYVQVSGGGTVWDIIANTPAALGQSEIGVYTIPKGFTGYLYGKQVSVDSKKTADLFFYHREGADVVVAPFVPMKIIDRYVGITGPEPIDYKFPKGPYVGPCDIGFMGSVVTGTGEISVGFEILLVED